MAMAHISSSTTDNHLTAPKAYATATGSSPSPFARNVSSSNADFASKYLMEAAAGYSSSECAPNNWAEPHFHQNHHQQQNFGEVSEWQHQFIDPGSFSATSTGNAEARRSISYTPSPTQGMDKSSWNASNGLSLTVDPSKGGLALQGIASQCFADFPTDPGFAERAARYSSFHHNGAYSPNKVQQQLSRTSSFSANVAAEDGLGDQEGKFFSKLHKVAQQEAGLGGFNSPVKEDSQNSVEQGPVQGTNNNSSSRKRKNATSEERSKETTTGSRKDSKNAESEDTKTKRQKGSDSKEKDETKGKADNRSSSENSGGSSSPKSAKDNPKPPEPPKQDYIHVRARRGQATDSHSLAERVRREKISERMKFLQDLVPGCSKVTGKAVMLDEIINYVQSLQRQVEFLSMKLAAVNPRLDLNLEGLLTKEVLHGRATSSPLSHDMPANYSHLQQQLQHAQQAVMQLGSCGLDLRSLGNSLDASSRTVVTSDAFADATSQISSVWDGDLHSVVQMFGLPTPNDPSQGHLPAGHMKVEI